MNKKYSGVIVPMVTPFEKEGKIDLKASEHITNFLTQNGTAPFVLGTTGENVSIPDEYRPAFVETIVKATNNRSLTYAGISSNCLNSSVMLSKQYFDAGIDAVVAHLPNFYPLNNDHMFRYFELLAELCPGPLIIYNMPKTTHHSIPLDVIDTLSKHPNIAGLKDSDPDINRLEKAAALWKDREDFSILVGCAANSTIGLTLGADGIVPSTGNLSPKMYRSLYDAVLKGDFERAEYYQQKTAEISQIYQKNKTLSESLSALKVMMKYFDLCEPYVLPPLQESSQNEKKDIFKQIKAIGMIE